MSVSGSIADALSRFGRPMILRRLTLGPGGVQTPTDVSLRGVPKGASPDKLASLQAQATTLITISDKEIVAAGWPGPPKGGDIFQYDGETKTVLPKGVETKKLGTEILVHVCQCKG